MTDCYQHACWRWGVGGGGGGGVSGGGWVGGRREGWRKDVRGATLNSVFCWSTPGSGQALGW